MDKNDFSLILSNQKKFFRNNGTLDVNFRIHQLKKLKSLIIKNEEAIYEALKKDLNKSDFESYVSEVGFVLGEINFTIKNIKNWCRVKKVKTPLVHLPGKSYILKEPYGSVLIIGPWNYPFQLLIAPLVGAIAAGNCALLKPSELSPNVSKFITKLINENFNAEYIHAVEGGIEETSSLLSLKWDYIFFTGSVNVGKVVMKAASYNLAPVTLELGGKSPCIIDKSVNLKLAAKRLVWGKFFNTGQTCIAPDYLFIHKDIVKDFIPLLKNTIKEFYGENPINSEYYGRIINTKHFTRLNNYLKDGTIIFGGNVNEEELYISPTLIIGSSINSPIMNDEIFGPILPMFQYENLNEVISFINSRPKPLSLYFFSNDKNNIKKITSNTSSGSVCINDTLSQITTPYLPFGGVGTSGMGKYHGKWSFDTFTHEKSVMNKSFKFDLSVKYPPYTFPIKILRRFFE
ncbi:Aldehyde dehydrogenase [Clostridium liquoris]|jgi:aldehyde dehydrogenase (NAD+)|uniref:Aldehyde dehydrogenase n=1 Tax=Clostridium liquoris TaxID=1289519 RepID=A0A2T0B8D0_9CLOT|nr:aldehyde dehydrogenase [Clostridium liquoris]PRR80115.1 Aldehyde dehydrogenase [Clostridium liquoris]